MVVSKIAFLFPGQGAQSVGMAGPFVEAAPRAAELFARASEVLGYDLLAVCQQGPTERLDSTEVSQPALFVCSLAAVEVLRQNEPDVVLSCQAAAGLSLGEYSALVFAGVMSFEDGLRVVQERGRAMQAAADANPSGMVSILGLERQQVEEICDRARDAGQVLEVANLLCPGNIAISGHTDACERAAQLATQAGAMKTVPLAVAGAFHTALMSSAVERLAAALAEVQLARPEIVVVSNVDAQPHVEPEEIRQLLIQQVCSRVRWEDSVRYLIGQGFETFYEVGPGRVLRGLMKRTERKIPCRGVVD
jgi:[acyl-carrier-protein] S-malonyltransferase